MSAQPFFLATSLAPGRDAALQRAAVKSWHDAGFAVLSVNAAREIPALAATHPDVTLIAAPQTGEKIAGKPVPFVTDLLKALRAAVLGRGIPLADCLVGLINDDIHLRLTPAETAALAERAQRGLILIARVDVPDAAALDRFQAAGAEAYSVGYDGFLMSGDVLEDFKDAPFCLGMPFWDYWLPLTALLNGRALHALASPAALHIAHETRWDDTVYVFFHALIGAVLDVAKANRSEHHAPAARQFALLFDAFSHVYGDVFARGTTPGAEGEIPPGAVEALATFYDRFQEVAVHHIKACAKPFALGSHTP